MTTIPVKIKFPHGRYIQDIAGEKVDLLPVRASEGAACYDVRTREGFILAPGDTIVAKTGFALEIPEGYKAMIWSRSSFGVKGDRVHIGTIDSDYRGEVSVVVQNLSSIKHRQMRRSLRIHAGERIAQMSFERVITAEFMEVDELAPSERGEGGFGSTGKI